MACGLGGYHSTPSQIARDMAATVTSTRPRTVMGSGQRTSPDLATFANGVMIRYEVVTTAGQCYASEVAYHKGHYKNPLSDVELEDKYRALVGDVLPSRRADALLDRLWHLEEVTDMGMVVKLTTI